MKLVCELCPASATNVPDWYSHLVNPSHQEKCHSRSPAILSLDEKPFRKIDLKVPEFMTWPDEEDNRSIVVSGFDTFLNYPVELVEHFCNFGLITEYVFDPIGQYAILQFDQRRCVDTLIINPFSKIFRGRKIDIRVKTYVSIAEWIILMDLNAKYSKTDQRFFIDHFDLKSELANLHIDSQVQCFVESSGLKSTTIHTFQVIMGDLYSILRPVFDKLYLFPVHPFTPGLLDDDSIFEVYVDPYASIIEYPGPSHTHSTRDYIRPEYQAAIVRSLYAVQSKLCIPNGDQYCHQVQPFPKYPIVNSTKQFLRGLSFSHKTTGSKVRLRFDGVMDANIGSLLGFMISLDKTVAPFLRILFYWARITRLTQKCPEIIEILTAMALVFLHRKNLLPTISTLQHINRASYETILGVNAPPIPYVDGWDVSFIKDKNLVQTFLEEHADEKSSKGGDALVNGDLKTKTKEDSSKSINVKIMLKMLEEFFQEFGEMDYSSTVVSPFSGELIPKRHFKSGNEALLSDCYTQYKKKARVRPLNLNSTLIIQHFFNLSKNISENINPSLAKLIKQNFLDTRDRVRILGKTQAPVFMEVFGDIDVTLGGTKNKLKFEHIVRISSKPEVSKGQKISKKSKPIKPPEPSSEPPPEVKDLKIISKIKTPLEELTDVEIEFSEPEDPPIIKCGAEPDKQDDNVIDKAAHGGGDYLPASSVNSDEDFDTDNELISSRESNSPPTCSNRTVINIGLKRSSKSQPVSSNNSD